MRLLLIDQYGELGGAQRCLVEAAAGFAARDWELDALVPRGPLAAALAAQGAEVRDLPCGPFASGQKSVRDAARFAGQLPRQISEIRRSLARNQRDAIYVNGPRVLPAAALARSGKPLIYHSHWMVPQRSAAALARAALRGSRATVISTSRLAAQWLDGAVPPERVAMVYNGAAGFGREPRPRQLLRNIAILGRVSPEKGQREFVQAARIAFQAAPQLRFTVCGAPLFSGDRYFEQVRAEAAGLPVEFCGWTENTGAFLAQADLLVVASSAIDNIPRVILEAFAAGVPVLAFASGAIPELIEDGQTGLLVPGRTPQALAAAMIDAAGQPERLNRIAARAYQRWQDRYTLRRFQSEVCDAVEEACRRHRKPLASAGASAAA